MLTLRAAARLLAQADSLRALRAIARPLGFHSARTLDHEAQRVLHLQTLVESADLARGDGARRCVLALLPPTTSVTRVDDGVSVRVDAAGEPPSAFATDPRELTRQLCLALVRHAPARDWCVITLDHSANHLCIATVAPDNANRIQALRVDRRRIVDSDADTLRALAAIHEAHPTLHHTRVADILGRDALSQRFYRTLEQRVSALATDATGRATPAIKRELALTCASRCLFLAFLEAKGWLNHDRQFLLHQTTHHLEHGGALFNRFLRPLFFGTLNTPRTQRAARARNFGHVPFLNGGLFSPTPLERRHRDVHFSDDSVAAFIIDLLDRYRFTAREDSLRWSEASVDPEMLGRAFESLMAADERHSTGSYYTPPTLVETVVRDALSAALPTLPPDALNGDSTPLALSPETRQQLLSLKVIDPACGSGAFLVYTLEAIANLRARAGDPMPLHDLRRDTLARSIFGVDRNPMAVWLCELRLWLSIVIECPESRITHIPPLPNLDHHIRLGDTLAGGNFQFAPPTARRLTNLRLRYTRATGTRKRTLAVALDREERQRAVGECQRIVDRAHHDRLHAIDAMRSRDLFGQRTPRIRHERLQLIQLRQQHRDATRQLTRLQLGGALPFRFAAQFADVAADGGFALVIGNPPWVRPHALPVAERVRLRAEFRSMRHAAWQVGAARAGAATGFAAQADLAAAFVERSMQLLAPRGTAALLVPAKLWRALAGGGLRAWLHEHADLNTVRDWSDAPSLFDAAVYPSLVVAQRRTNPRRTITATTNTSDAVERPIHVALARATSEASFSIAPSRLSLDGDPSAPWILLPDKPHHALNTLRQAGPALGDSPLGRPTLGVKLGCNAAFLVHAVEHDDEFASVTAGERHGFVERHMLRPVLRGDSVAPREGRTTSSNGDPRVIWTHDAQMTPLRTLPSRTARWLAQWRPQLERRRDARTRQPWWTLFRTDAARFELPRVVWADIGKTLRPRVLAAGDPTVPLNTCYVMRAASTDDALALCALLASPLAAAWFETLAEPARGGFRRFMGWTVATLPVPRDWTSARPLLAALADSAQHNSPPSTSEYLDVLARAYGVPAAQLLPLIEWSAQ